MTRPTFDELGLATARLWATRSADAKVQVGACLLDRWNRVVGVGYNGRASGEPNERESMAQGQSGFIHAEVNALLAANWNGEGHTLFVTHEPCATCARLIINSRRVTRVVYQQGYTEVVRADAGLPSGAKILRDAGLSVEVGRSGD
ncbi:MAG TPA: deoxycytidylate deaminase [Propionibacterium sp.]|nr:deoxycytidylate deaminase [Propionibacterium sp.]